MKRTTAFLSAWLGLAVICALVTPAWSQESVPAATGPAAAPSVSAAPSISALPELTAPSGRPPVAASPPVVPSSTAPPIPVPTQQIDYEMPNQRPRPAPRTTAQIARRKDGRTTTLIAGGIVASIGLGMAAASIAMLTQNTQCDIGSSSSSRNAGCGNLILGWTTAGFGVSHVLIGSILLLVGGSIDTTATY